MAKSFKFDALLKAAEKQKEEADKRREEQKDDALPLAEEPLAVEIDETAEIKKNIIIRDTFKDLIPPLATDEFEKLKDNILAEGCRDALVLWKNEEEYILIDGHNRYQICNEFGLDFKIEVREFTDEEAVSDWMVNNQLGKRNVTEETKSYLRGLQYNREKRKVGGTGANQYSEQKGQSVPTAIRLAEQHKVSEKTIKRDEKFALAIEKITGESQALKWDILNKKIPIPKTATLKLAEEEEETARQIGNYLQEGKSFNQALKEARQKNKPSEAEDPHKLYMRNLKASIMNCLNEALRTKNKEFIEELRDYIDELESAIQD
ncbi:MAG: ParB N-terminal domain-containing protein [Microscillaceae bacterium]|nr:ParB N-terminal domain-containing protein [Microscillaceae bacterium]